jgi:peptide-methionine (S)-S-oxide reductase
MKQKHNYKDGKPMAKEIATLGGGCFWCLEAVYDQLKGVEDVVSGYTGGHVVNPTYRQVCEKNTGHAEVIQVSFDNEVISFGDLLDVFFTIHDPTTPNRQGNDVGPQYRSAIFTHSEAQKQIAEEKIKSITAEKLWDNPIVTEISPLDKFYAAEDYHQRYFELNPEAGYCQFVVAPKVAKFRKQYISQLKKEYA